MTDQDDAYANAAHIPGGAEYPQRWAAAAAEYRAVELALGRAMLNLRHGEGEREVFDLFYPAGRPEGLVVFIHGGYWLRFDKSLWSHLAAGPAARGWAVAMPSYTLAPAARISQITPEVARAVLAAAGRVPGPLVVAGHSAGGHLAARQVCEDTTLPAPVVERIESVLAISGVHDLRPLLRTRLNVDFLRLDAAEAEAESPSLRTPREGARVHVWVGGGERPEFIRQSALLANIWTGLGADMRETVEPAAHHFAVLDGLRGPASPIIEALVGDWT